MMAQLVRTVVIAALCVGAGALIIWGPRGGPPIDPDRVHVTYWEKWTDFEGAAMHALVDRFNATTGAERGIYVEYVATTNVDMKTMVATAGGDPPDLAGLWQRNVHSFAASDALTSLDERARSAGLRDGALLDIYEHACEYHGELFALPLTPSTIALYYNKDALAEFADALRDAGLDPERAPRTIAELDAYADIIQRSDARGDLELLAYLPGTAGSFAWFWQTWPIWFGGRLYDASQKRMLVDQPAFIDAYTWVSKYAERFDRRRVARFEAGLGNFASPDNPFISGHLAMVRQGPWFANTIRQFAPDIHYGVAPFPTIDGVPRAYYEEDVITVPRGARHPDEAWSFIEWLYTAPPQHYSPPDGSTGMGYEYYESRADGKTVRKPMPPLRPIEWLCWMHCKNNPLRNPDPAFVETHPNPAIEVHEALARAEHADTVPPLPNWAEIENEFVAAYADIWAAGPPVRERLRECQRRIDILTKLTETRLARHAVAYP
ncbi:MAG: extracellular solute-binding protein [Phycisphaerales bacterium]|nr:extracellular solute-binding protein [Phycisphaerales bacterium]